MSKAEPTWDDIEVMIAGVEIRGPYPTVKDWRRDYDAQMKRARIAQAAPLVGLAAKLLRVKGPR